MTPRGTVYLLDPFGCVRAYSETLASHLNALTPTRLLSTGYTEVRGPVDRGDGSLQLFFLRHTTRLKGSCPWLPRLVLKALGLLEYLCLDLPRLRSLRGPNNLFHWQWIPLSPITLLWLRLLKVPVDVWTSHDPFKKSSGLIVPAKRVIFHGRALQVDALRLAPQLEGKCQVIPHPLLFDGRRARPRTGKVRVLGFVGLLKDYKGLNHLLAAWRSLALSGRTKSARLSISGELRLGWRAKRRLMEDLERTPSVRWRSGYMSDEQFVGRLQDLDLLVLPHLSVGQSGVALAALGLGVPMLVARTGALPELLEGAQGPWVFESGDVQDLANKIEALLRTGPAAMRRHEIWAKKRARSFAPGRIANAHLDLYRSLTPLE